MRAPLDDNLFFEHVGLIECHENLGHRWDKVWVLNAHEAFDTAKERLLVLLGCHDLHGIWSVN
jgi:hypothetical protein